MFKCLDLCLLDFFEEFQAQRITRFREGFLFATFLGDRLDVRGELDLRAVALRFGEHLIDPRSVESFYGKGELLRDHANHVFLDLLAVAVEGILTLGVFLITKVSFDDRVVIQAGCLVMEFYVVLDTLQHHENRSAGDGDGHVNLELPPVTKLQRDPCEDDGDGRADEDESIYETGKDRKRPLWPRVISSHAEIDIGGEEAAKEHDLGGQKEPDGDLRVDQARVFAGVDDVGNFHF